DESEARRLESRERIADARENLQVFRALRRIRAPLSDDGSIDDAVPVEEDGGGHIVDSHFVGYTLSAGCETSRCQTTAWNASLCGVIVSGLTVGMITHASATCAV